jgi:hypothetical protein
MPPPFGRRPGGIATRVSFSAADPRGNGFDVMPTEGDGAIAEERKHAWELELSTSAGRSDRGRSG